VKDYCGVARGGGNFWWHADSLLVVVGVVEVAEKNRAAVVLFC